MVAGVWLGLGVGVGVGMGTIVVAGVWLKRDKAAAVEDIRVAEESIFIVLD